MLDAIVQVDGDLPVGQVLHLFLVLLQFQGLALELLLALQELYPLGGGGAFQLIGQVGQLGAVPLLLLVDVVSADPGQQVRLVAVEVDKGLEAVLFTAVKEPVDGPLLVGP